MKKLLLVFIVLIALVAGGIYYFLKPKTLGVSYTSADLESLNKKLGVSYEAISASDAKGKTLVFTGSHKVDEVFTSSELTAAINDRPNQYPYFPFRNVQVRVNPDGSVEGTGTVNYKDIVNYLVALGVSPQDIAKGAEKFRIPNTNIPLYLKVSGNITNNKGAILVESAKVAGISVPADFVSEYTPIFNGFIEGLIQERRPSYNLEKLEVSGNQVYFKGTSPDLEQAVKSL